MDQALAFGLLAGALTAFLLSTRQWRWFVRLPIWLAGAAMLGASLYLTFAMPGHHGLFRAIADFAANLADPGESVLVQALTRNAPTVGRVIVPLLDLFLVFGVFLGILAVAAFTPGERLDKAARPLTYGLLGMILGGVMALTIVAIGFGGEVKPRSLAAQLQADSVRDGDTIWMGETSVRIFGLDAPELHQQCWRDAQRYPCGVAARDHLAEMVRGQVVLCKPHDDSSAPPQESFGRPILLCEIAGADLAGRMIRDGFAVQHKAKDFGYSALEIAAGAQRQRHLGCMLRPDIWRNERAVRDAFIAGRLSEIERNLLIGDCSVPPTD